MDAGGRTTLAAVLADAAGETELAQEADERNPVEKVDVAAEEPAKMIVEVCQ